MTSALVIINAQSRTGQENRLLVVEELRGMGLAIKVPEIDSPADIPKVIRAHENEVDAVVMGGGDGTMNCAAQALAHSRLTLGIVPLGTANDLARTLAIPPDIPTACRIIGAGHREAIDLGQVNGHCFFNVANIGLGVQVRKSLSREIKKTWGALSYMRAAMDAWRRQSPFEVELEARDHHLHMSTIQVAVGNGRFYGGGMVIHENASIQDNRLDLYAIRPKTFWDLLDASPWLRFGRTSAIDGVLHISSSEISVRTRDPMVVSADGEEIGTTPAHFKVLPKAVNVFTPAQQE